MGLVRFDTHLDNVVTPQYSPEGRGPVLRSNALEITQMSFPAGGGSTFHHHPEEQIMYVLSGLLRIRQGDDDNYSEYEVGVGEANFNPSNIRHSTEALQPTVVLSIKNVVDPQYAATGSLA
jgi:quercetin dioxygenase-like cupin family protein